MKGVTRQEKPSLQFRGPTGLDELQVKFFVRSINLVAHDRMAQRGEMDPDLMGAPSPRKRSDNAKAVAGRGRERTGARR